MFFISSLHVQVLTDATIIHGEEREREREREGEKNLEKVIVYTCEKLKQVLWRLRPEESTFLVGHNGDVDDVVTQEEVS